MSSPIPVHDDAQSARMLVRLWASVAVVLALVVIWGAVQPEDPLQHIIHTDTQRHILAFGTIGLCAGLMPTARARVLALAGVLAFGLLIEVIQIPLPSRTASLSDLFASTVGGFGGFGLAAAAVSAVEALRGRVSGSLTSAPQRR